MIWKGTIDMHGIQCQVAITGNRLSSKTTKHLKQHKTVEFVPDNKETEIVEQLKITSIGEESRDILHHLVRIEMLKEKNASLGLERYTPLLATLDDSTMLAFRIQDQELYVELVEPKATNKKKRDRETSHEREESPKRRSTRADSDPLVSFLLSLNTVFDGIYTADTNYIQFLEEKICKYLIKRQKRLLFDDNVLLWFTEHAVEENNRAIVAMVVVYLLAFYHQYGSCYEEEIEANRIEPFVVELFGKYECQRFYDLVKCVYKEIPSLYTSFVTSSEGFDFDALAQEFIDLFC